MSNASRHGRQLAIVQTDVIIVGGGMAALSAAIGTARDGLSTVVCEASERFGGQAAKALRVTNYPGFPLGVAGQELVRLAVAQARELGAALRPCSHVHALIREAHGWRVSATGSEYVGRSVLLATGAEPEPIASAHAGVHYYAGHDVLRGLIGARVAIVGSGNSAGAAAVWLANHGTSVTLFARQPTMSERVLRQVLQDRLIVLRADARVTTVAAGPGGSEVALAGGERLTVDAVLAYCGWRPSQPRLATATDERGMILTAGGATLAVPGASGMFAAGTARAGAGATISAAAGDGSCAAMEIVRYLRVGHQPPQGG